MSVLLEVENLRVHRGGVQVLEFPHFAIKPEEKVAIVGPNGAGKSSLLLSLACLIGRSHGRIRFKGDEVLPKDEVTYRRRIAVVFQEPLLFDTTVLDNVAEGLRIRGMARGEARDAARESLGVFKVLHLERRSAHKLSGGEAQRVSLARAFAVRPELLLMDEPFTSLDLPTRIALAEDLGRILHESGTAAIIATHDRLEAFHLVDRLVVMERGAVVQQGIPKEVLEQPVNAFVAAFRRTSGGN